MIEIQEGEVIAGKYRLTERLARGGMGAVWRAQHVTLGVPVAVKFMAPRYADDSHLRTRFEREAKAAAQLRSPNVVQIIDYGVEDATPYLVMELLHGEDLGERLAREYRLSVIDILPIVTQIGKALRRAHDEGIVHRDLKPANIFLVPQDGELLVKVLDFGIAKWLRPEPGGDVTKTGHVMGSPHYMSPEQVRGARDVDQRTDLWALGVIIYRALTGHLPFEGVQPVDIGVKIWTESPILPTVHVPELDPQIDVFMAKALSVDVEKRFQNVKEMMDAAALLPTKRVIVNTLVGLHLEPPEATTRRYQPVKEIALIQVESNEEELQATHGTVVVKQENLVDESPSDAPTIKPFRSKSEELGAKKTYVSGKWVKAASAFAFILIVGLLGVHRFGGENQGKTTVEAIASSAPIAEGPSDVNVIGQGVEVTNEIIVDAGSPAPMIDASAQASMPPLPAASSKQPAKKSIPVITKPRIQENAALGLGESEKSEASEQAKKNTQSRWTTADE